jgi:hypothetical protein
MRTAVCPVCGAKSLKWAQNAIGMRYLVDFTTGVEHYKSCPGVKVEGRADGAPDPTPGDGPGKVETEPGEGRGGDSPESGDGGGDQGEGRGDSGESGDGDQDGDGTPEPGEIEMPEPETPETETEPEPAPKSPEPEHSDHRLQPTLNRWVKIGQNSMMVGPAGGGKTTAARIAANVNGFRYFEQSMGPQTSQWDLIGYNGPNGEFHPGFLYAPFKFGGLAMLDEVDAANPGILVVLNSMMANGHYSFPNGEEVERHADFRIVAGANTYGRGADRLYVGRSQLDAATLDRFAVLDWDYDESVEFRWAGNDDIARTWTVFVQQVRKVAFDLKMRFVVSPRASIEGAKMLRGGCSRKEVEEARLWKGLSRDERAKFAHLDRS